MSPGSQPRLAFRRRLSIQAIRTDTEEPRPPTGDVSWNEEVRHQGVQEKDAPPDVERIMAIVRQQERVLDPGVKRVSDATGFRNSRDERELVNCETHDGKRDAGDERVPGKRSQT